MQDLDIRLYINGEWVRWPHILVCQKYFKYYKHREKIINGINVSYMVLFFKKNKDRYNLTNDSLSYFDMDAIKSSHRKICKWDPTRWQIETFTFGYGEIMLVLKQKIN